MIKNAEIGSAHLFGVKRITPVMGMCLLSSVSAELPAMKSDKPNIIIIMADDLGYGDIGCFGSDHIKTPVLDRMAAEGLTFTDFYSNGTVCSPTRAALMTGNYQQRAGIEGVIRIEDGQHHQGGLSPNETTISGLLNQHGYATGLFGKWHLGYRTKYNPVHHGFVEFYGFLSGNVDYISHRDGSNTHDWWHQTDTIHESGYLTDLITDQALLFMEKAREQPFFLLLSHAAPHFPFQGRGDPPDRLPGQTFEMYGSRPDKEVAYKEMIEVMDENIGRIFTQLRDLGLDQNTFVFFCSDNGALSLGSNGELRGHKSSLWEGGIRVPAIAWYPAEITPGSVTDTPVTTMDFFPTMLSLATIETDHTFDGVDVLPVLFSQEEINERPLFWRYGSQKAVRLGDWKYAVVEDEPYLFNLRQDKAESTNVVHQNPEMYQKLKGLLNDWEQEMNQYKQQAIR